MCKIRITPTWVTYFLYSVCSNGLGTWSGLKVIQKAHNEEVQNSYGLM